MPQNDPPLLVASTDQLGLAPERAAFEDWQSDGGRWTKAVERDDEGYKLATSHAAWTAWRAGWVRAEKMARERCARSREQFGEQLDTAERLQRLADSLDARGNVSDAREVQDAANAFVAERSSRGMFVARLENIQKSGDNWLTAQAVLALLNDCDMLATQA